MYKHVVILFCLCFPSVALAGGPKVHGNFVVDFVQSTVTYQIHHGARYVTDPVTQEITIATVDYILTDTSLVTEFSLGASPAPALTRPCQCNLDERGLTYLSAINGGPLMGPAQFFFLPGEELFLPLVKTFLLNDGRTWLAHVVILRVNGEDIRNDFLFADEESVTYRLETGDGDGKDIWYVNWGMAPEGLQGFDTTERVEGNVFSNRGPNRKNYSPFWRDENGTLVIRSIVATD